MTQLRTVVLSSKGVEPTEVLLSVRNSGRCARLARAHGYQEEAAALEITTNWIAHLALGHLRDIEAPKYAHEMCEELIVGSFYNLGQITVLPAGDQVYWRERLAEALSSSLMFAAAKKRPVQIGLLRVQSPKILRQTLQFSALLVARFLLPEQRLVVEPIMSQKRYTGTAAGIQIALANIELIGGNPEAALKRLRIQLAERLMDYREKIYASLLVLSAARMTNNQAAVSEWERSVADDLDLPRTDFNFLEGRIFATQYAADALILGTRVWYVGNEVDARDLWSVAERTRARVLLDAMRGHWHPPEARDDSTDSGKSTTSGRVEVEFAMAEGFEQSRDELLQTLTAGTFLSSPAMLASPYDWGAGKAELDDNHIKSLTAESERSRARYGSYSGQAQIRDLEAIQAALLADELLIEFYIPEDRFWPYTDLWILIVSRQAIYKIGKFLDLISGSHSFDEREGFVENAEFLRQVVNTRIAIGEGADHDATKLLATWFIRLIQPVIDLGLPPEAFDRWIVVPHGPLHALPFAALTDADGKRLIERVALTTVPSANVWLEIQRARPRMPIGMVTVGDAGSHDGLGPAALPNCLLESDAIVDLFQGVSCLRQLKGPHARLAETWDALRSAQLAHIAGHGSFSLKEPRNDQAVLLSGDPTKIAALDAWQIRRGDLRGLRLLFLNICNGATCRYGPGGEPMGLLDAALVAGVENMIGGMWDLPDAEAMRFAIEFFRAFVNNRYDPSKSLRSAMTNAIADQRPLRSWAGYQLVGPGRSLGSSINARESP